MWWKRKAIIQPKLNEYVIEWIEELEYDLKTLEKDFLTKAQKLQAEITELQSSKPRKNQKAAYGK